MAKNVDIVTDPYHYNIIHYMTHAAIPALRKVKSKRQSAKLFLVDFDLSSDKKVTFQQKSFGPYVKIVKDYKSIGFNYQNWRKFRYHLPVMRKDDYRLDITPYKRVRNIKYDGYTYIAFEQDWKTRDGYWNTSYINLHLKEWEALVYNLWKIDQVIPFGRAKRCFVCNDERIKMPSSVQSEEHCHCHTYNCPICSPLCEGCGMNKYCK